MIPREVLDVVGSIRVALEIKFGEKKCASKLKFTGRIKPCLSWTQRADVICFALHPGFADGDIFLAAKVFDMQKGVSVAGNNTCYSNWIPFEKSLVP